MSYKSRGNYPLGMYVTQEAWDAMFPKEKKDESEAGVGVTISTDSQPIQGTTKERITEIPTGENSNK